MFKEIIHSNSKVMNYLFIYVGPSTVWYDIKLLNDAWHVSCIMSGVTGIVYWCSSCHVMASVTCWWASDWDMAFTCLAIPALPGWYHRLILKSLGCILLLHIVSFLPRRFCSGHLVFAGYLHQAAGYCMMLHDFSFCFHDIAACLSCLVLALESTSYLSSHQFGFTTTSTDFDRLVGSLGSVPRVLHLSLGGMQQQQGCFTGSLTAAASSADVMLQQLSIKNFVFVYFRLICHYCSKCGGSHVTWRPVVQQQ